MAEAKKHVHYFVDLNECCAHLFSVTMTISHAESNQKISLPVWTPGSYMVREFAQHVVAIDARVGDKAVSIEKINKNTYQLHNIPGEVTVTYQVYGFDSSIRAAFIDSCQAFFNGTAIFFRPHGHDDAHYTVKITRPTYEGYAHAEVATALSKADTDKSGFGTYEAWSYDELVDHPFQISEMKRIYFDVLSTPHQMVLVGDVRPFDEKRLVQDLTKVCEQHIRMFEGKAPFTEYLFIARFEEGGHGGLEHRNSSMLLGSPYDLPKIGMKEPDTHYRKLLSLCSHEYFHAWNVKRLKPRSFIPLNFDEECYTRMLWIFEGVTNYYDYLALKRAGVINVQQYLEGMAKDITRLLRTPGRLRQSASDSSFDAWIKLYRHNENSANETVSYYLKGGFVAMCLDLALRKATNDAMSLDEVMRRAFRLYGEKGLTEEDFFVLLAECGLKHGADFRRRFVDGTEELPLEEMLSLFGVECTFLPDEITFDERTKMHAYLGCKIRFDDNERGIISFVEKDSPAMRAGLSPGDEVVAIAHTRLDTHNATDLLQGIVLEEPVKITYARKKMLRETVVTPVALPLHSCRLGIKSDCSRDEKNRLQNWLGTLDVESNK